jgi:tRNA A37 N6-isopentenylltransferase MiaA
MYARRQATWFRREPGICWLDAATSLPLDEALDAARGFLTTVS